MQFTVLKTFSYPTHAGCNTHSAGDTISIASALDADALVKARKVIPLRLPPVIGPPPGAPSPMAEAERKSHLDSEGAE